MEVYYYNSLQFYLHLKHFLSEEFKCIRNAYLFELLPEKEHDKLMSYVASIFPEKFLLLISILRKKYRADKIKYFLKKFYQNLKNQFEKPRCYVETHAEFSNTELEKIEEAIKAKFGIDQMVFRYSVNEELLYGISFRLGYKMYDLSLCSMLNKVEKKTLEKIIGKSEGI